MKTKKNKRQLTLVDLIGAVETAGVDCDGEDLADVIWLACWIPAAEPAPPSPKPPPQPSAARKPQAPRWEKYADPAALALPTDSPD